MFIYSTVTILLYKTGFPWLESLFNVRNYVLLMMIVMTVFFAPMIAIPLITAVANNLLIAATPVTGIPCPYIGMMFPWVMFVNHYFVTVVGVKMIPGWQSAC